MNFKHLLSEGSFMGNRAMAANNVLVSAAGGKVDSEGNDITTTGDPNKETPLEGAFLDRPGKGIDQPGKPATGSALDKAELVEKRVSDYVDKFRAHKFPMMYDVAQKARQIKVDVKDPENYEIGEAILEAVTTAATPSQETSQAQKFTVQVADIDANIFKTGGTAIVEGLVGYNESGTEKDGSPLILYIAAIKDGELTCMAVNGKAPNAGGEFRVLTDTIPAGTTLLAMASALSESEVEIEADNVMPRKKQAYLQKKVCAITWTELFERIEKKAKWSVQDVKDAALDKYKREYTRAMLISAPSRFMKKTSKGNWEYAYTQKGILRQLRLNYQLKDGQIDLNDLIGISAMLFGKYDAGNEITAYCGTMFVQRLLNLDFKDRNEVTIRQEEDETVNIKRTKFICNFGTINFVHEYALDDIGYSECAVLYNVEEAKHFFYQNGKTLSIDHSKGEGGEVREARTDYFIQDDTVELGGFQNMIVGPAELMSGFTMSATNTVVSVNKLSDITSPADGDIAYLIADIESDNGNPTKLGLYEYDLAATKWVSYDGKSINVI